MNAARWRTCGRFLVFALAFLVAASMREGDRGAVTQSVIWLPSGVALAGLWLLGLRACWVIAFCTLIQRGSLNYEIQVALSAALGSTAEAVLGLVILRRFGFRATLARLRDVVAIFVAAGLAPLASILFSWLGRLYVWTDPNMPFYSGWDGWWRMNALGVLTAAPTILTWLAVPVTPFRARAAGTATAIAAGLLVLLVVVVTIGPAGATGVLMLNLALPITLYAAVRFGPRGAASAGALAAILVVAATIQGHGPFLMIAPEGRHLALQLFELLLVAVPLVFGALIAEREAARAHGLQSEKLLHSTKEALPDITLRLRGDGHCVDLYIPTGTVGPFTRQNAVGRPIRDFLPEDAAEVMARTIRQVLAERTAITVELGLVLQGQRRFLETRCAPYDGDDVLAVVRDISNRKWLERTTAFEAHVLGLVATGSPTADIFAAIVDGMENLTQNASCSITLPGPPDDGIEEPEVGSLYGWSVAIRDSAGSPLGTFAVRWQGPHTPEAREIASMERAGALVGIVLERERRNEALRHTEAQLRQSQKMEAVGKLAGGVAHDFNNLLTAIFGYAEAIRDEAPGIETARAHAAEVLRAAERAAALTRQLLAYSRQQVLSPQVLELSAIVEQLGGILRRIIGEDIGLLIERTFDEGWVRVDRSQMEQVILNLVVNARDAMPDGGTLTIGIAAVDVDAVLARAHADLRVGPYLALRVQDTGVGMAGDVQARAFDPFFTTKEPGKGTGLGLSTVYGIVNQSGGAVWLESRPGAGTTAWIYLPRVAPAIDMATTPAAPAASPVEATLLLAEDEPVVRDLVQRLLEQAGYRVLSAADGMHALEVSRSHDGDIDLLVTDVVMPRMGGRELADRLRAERPGLRVLYMSGYANEAWDVNELPGQAGDFLQKPFAPRELSDRVRIMLQPGPIGHRRVPTIDGTVPER